MATEEQKDTEEREDAAAGARTEEPVEDAASAAAAGESREGDESDDDADEGDGSTDDADDADDSARASDDAGDDDEDDEDDEDDAAAAAPAAKAGGASKKAAGRATAGARLAAAKAAKAARKAAKKGRERDEGLGATLSGRGPAGKEPVEALKETPLGQAASKATDWAQANRPLAMGVFAAIVLAAAGWVGYAWWQSSQNEAAGALLEDAVRIATAEIVDEDDPPAASAGEDDADEAPTFTSRQARSEAALEAYRRVLSQYAGSEAARWARLGEARALFDLGQYDEARDAYEGALREAGGEPMVAWRALEGIGFTYEVARDWDEAIEKYEELRSIDDGAYQAVAEYHIARMRIAKGETVQATSALRELVQQLRSDAEGEEPEFPYVLAQAEVRLRELDPSSAAGSGSPMMIGPGAGGGGGLPPGLEGIDPAILEQLRRQLAAGAAGGEGGEGGGGGGEE